MVREQEEAGGVSVQFTNTTVNTEAGQDTVNRRWSEKETQRMPLKCSTHKVYKKYRAYCIFT